MKYLIGFFIIMAVWIAGCSMQMFVFKIEQDAYLMLYGFVVGSVGGLLSELIKE